MRREQLQRRFAAYLLVIVSHALAVPSQYLNGTDLSQSSAPRQGDIASGDSMEPSAEANALQPSYSMQLSNQSLVLKLPSLPGRGFLVSMPSNESILPATANYANLSSIKFTTVSGPGHSHGLEPIVLPADVPPDYEPATPGNSLSTPLGLLPVATDLETWAPADIATNTLGSYQEDGVGPYILEPILTTYSKELGVIVHGWHPCWHGCTQKKIHMSAIS